MALQIYDQLLQFPIFLGMSRDDLSQVAAHTKFDFVKEEEIVKVRNAVDSSRGAFVNPVEGSELAINQAQAQEFLLDLRERSQKMTLCQFIIMVTADSFDELERNTALIHTIPSASTSVL